MTRTLRTIEHKGSKTTYRDASLKKIKNPKKGKKERKNLKDLVTEETEE